MKKEKGFLKTIFAFTIGVLISAGVVYGYSTLASSVGFTPKGGLVSTNAQDAIDEVYAKSKLCKKVGSQSNHSTLSVGDEFLCDVDNSNDYNSSSEKFYFIEEKNASMVFLFSRSSGSVRPTVFHNTATGSGACFVPNKYFEFSGNGSGASQGYIGSLPTVDMGSTIKNFLTRGKISSNRYIALASTTIGEDFSCVSEITGGVGNCSCTTYGSYDLDVFPIIIVSKKNIDW